MILFAVSVHAARDKMANYNLRTGKKFLDENARKTGVITLPSGVQYVRLVSGSGTVHPNATDRVAIDYRYVM
jgi:FKBP-type peptidyl-prolyl cis-trans isomerase